MDDSIHDGALQSYHLAQWNSPKRSTIQFADYVEHRLAAARRVVDIGCGAGAATAHMASRHSGTEFIGIDLSQKLVGIARTLSSTENLRNLSFEVGDCFDLTAREGIDGVLSLQTLSWLPNYEEPLQQIFEKLSPDWVAASSLFYDGDISCRIEVDEHAAGRRFFYNVYAIPAVGRVAERFGYQVVDARPFEIDIDLPRPSDRNAMATYTVRTADPDAPERLQVSGPLLMNWHFVTLTRRAERR
jgi:trans-aconitate methyltransferase